MIELASYDVILVNSSAGKDSQAMLDVIVQQAREAGVLDRVVVVHCDLGRVEWKGTRELAEEQARHYSLRFEVVSRPQGDLLDHVEARGMWPSSAARYCTSEHKRGQVHRLITALVAERYSGKPIRILNCQGIRAEESTARSKRVEFENDERASNGKRVVDMYYPIFTWTLAQVWERIQASGVRHHYAYDLGMPRLSCVFCIFANENALVLAGKHNPELLAEYVRVEVKTGHQFTKKISLVNIQARVLAGDSPAVSDWTM